MRGLWICGMAILAFSPAARAAPDAPSERRKVLGEFMKLRDPFRRGASAASRKPRSELESFAVSEYKLLGVLTGPQKVRAMLLGPNGKTYIVSEKTLIGVNRGIISKITPTAVKVRERFTNELGEEESEEESIDLPPRTTSSEVVQADSAAQSLGQAPEQAAPQPGLVMPPQQYPAQPGAPAEQAPTLGNMMKPGGQ